MSSDVGRCDTSSQYFTVFSGTSSRFASSAAVGARPSSCASVSCIRRIRNSLSTMCDGSRIVLPWFASARRIPCLIHHAAYVLSLPPFFGSNRSTAFISPRLPSLIRSSSGSPSRA